MKTPDFTPAQIAAYVAALAGMVAALAGVDLSDGQKAAILAGVPAAIALFHLVSDAVVRNGRSRALAPAPAAPTVNIAAPETVQLAPVALAQPQHQTYADSAKQTDPAGAGEAQLHAADQERAGVPRSDADGQPYGDTEPEPAAELAADAEVTADGV